MGDPVEVGISLDRIHKPKIAWKLLVIVGILSLLGILIQQSILRQPGYQELETWMTGSVPLCYGGVCLMLL